MSYAMTLLRLTTETLLEADPSIRVHWLLLLPEPGRKVEVWSTPEIPGPYVSLFNLFSAILVALCSWEVTLKATIPVPIAL